MEDLPELPEMPSDGEDDNGSSMSREMFWFALLVPLLSMLFELV